MAKNPSRESRGHYRREYSCESGMSISNVCLEALEVGQTCSKTDASCIGGLLCDQATEKCVQKPTDSNDKTCGETWPCADGFECRDGECVVGSNVTCTAESECFNYNCNCLNSDRQLGRCSGMVDIHSWTIMPIPLGCKDTSQELDRCAMIWCKANMETTQSDEILSLHMDQEGCMAQHCSKEREDFMNCARLQATRLGKTFEDAFPDPERPPRSDSEANTSNALPANGLFSPMSCLVIVLYALVMFFSSF